MADSFRQEITRHFPEALISGHESLQPLMTNNPKDRHVLAAALKAGISLIVTFNLRHFPQSSIAPLNIEVRHPQDYLLTLHAMNAPVVMAKLSKIASEDSIEIEDALIRLGKSVPLFARQVIEEIGDSTLPEP